MKQYTINSLPSTIEEARDTLYYLRCKLHGNTSRYSPDTSWLKNAYPIVDLLDAHTQITRLVSMLNVKAEREYSCRAVDSLASSYRPITDQPRGANGPSEQG